jgi:hypothetical protein
LALAELRDGELEAVVEASSDEESGVSESEWGQGASPRRPAVTTLEDFIRRAEELGGSLWHWRRAAFALGGKGSRIGWERTPRFRRLGDSATGGKVGGRGFRAGSASPVSGGLVGGGTAERLTAGPTSPEGGLFPFRFGTVLRARHPYHWTPRIMGHMWVGRGPRRLPDTSQTYL